MQALKAQRESTKGYPAMDGTRREEVAADDPKLLAIKKQKPVEEEKREEQLPEAVTVEQP